jgi:MinD-like ATPase involved in chromosome partitioning or flagellar assembly/CheY-like chemotaxis protein
MTSCHVLLIEDSPDSALLVNTFLAASKIAEFHVVTAATLQLARAALARQRFDAILLDLNLPDSRGIDTFSRVRDLARGAAIVILTGVEDEAVATSAIGQGAADYLIKGEVGGEGLARRIRFAVERSRATAVAAPAEPPPAGRVTLLVGAKGGPGVSTMAINLAAAVSRKERSTILLELRSHGGTLAAMLGVEPPVTLDAIAEMGGANMLDASLSRLPFGPRLLAATTGAQPLGGSWDGAAADNLVQRIATLADHVFIDATLAQPELVKAAAARASFTLLVLEREPVSVVLGSRITGTLADWCGRTNCVGAALVTHLAFIDSAPLPAIRKELNCGIVGVIPPARELLQSYRRHGPIVLAQPESPVAVAFSDLAARIDQSPVEFLNVG